MKFDMMSCLSLEQQAIRRGLIPATSGRWGGGGVESLSVALTIYSPASAIDQRPAGRDRNSLRLAIVTYRMLIMACSMSNHRDLT